jgi:DNA polymerase alpha subunit B
MKIKAGARHFTPSNPTNPSNPSPRLNYTPVKDEKEDTPGKFHARNNRGQKEIFNPHVPLQVNDQEVRPNVDVSLLEMQKSAGRRYMFDQIQTIAAHLDDLIEEVTDSYLISHPDDVVQHPGIAHQGSILVVGRVCRDVQGDGSTALFLEAARRFGGVRVQLDFSQIDPTTNVGAVGFSVFPGMIVALRGTNPSGYLFCVEAVLNRGMIPSAVTSTRKLQEMYPDELPLNIMVASGPFTLDDDLNFDPLEAFLNVVKVEKPDVVLLFGPFVDAGHGLVKRGKVAVGLDELFKVQVRPFLFYCWLM